MIKFVVNGKEAYSEQPADTPLAVGDPRGARA